MEGKGKEKKTANQRIDELSQQVAELTALLNMVLSSSTGKDEAEDKAPEPKHTVTTTAVDGVAVVDSEVAPKVVVRSLTIGDDSWIRLVVPAGGYVWFPLVNGSVMLTDPIIESFNSEFIKSAGLEVSYPPYLQDIYQLAADDDDDDLDDEPSHRHAQETSEPCGDGHPRCCGPAVGVGIPFSKLPYRIRKMVRDILG